MFKKVVLAYQIKKEINNSGCHKIGGNHNQYYFVHGQGSGEGKVAGEHKNKFIGQRVGNTYALQKNKNKNG
jgi:hypothetical protein